MCSIRSRKAVSHHASRHHTMPQEHGQHLGLPATIPHAGAKCTQHQLWRDGGLCAPPPATAPSACCEHKPCSPACPMRPLLLRFMAAGAPPAAVIGREHSREAGQTDESFCQRGPRCAARRQRTHNPAITAATLRCVSPAQRCCVLPLWVGVVCHCAMAAVLLYAHEQSEPVVAMAGIGGAAVLASATLNKFGPKTARNGHHSKFRPHIVGSAVPRTAAFGCGLLRCGLASSCSSDGE